MDRRTSNRLAAFLAMSALAVIVVLIGPYWPVPHSERFRGHPMLPSASRENLPLWFIIPFSIVAPTWWMADCLKRNLDRTKTIKGLNWLWLVISVFSFCGLWVYTGNDISLVQRPSGWPLHHPCAELVFSLWGWLLWSRCTEISFAFLRDAYDKVGVRDPQSKLKPKDRLVLAFKSYIELVCNFTILFSLCPASSWKQAPLYVTDVLYFSATTITTSGNGAVLPAPGVLQFLSTYEIYCGLILLVVCFTIYTGMKPPHASDSP